MEIRLTKKQKVIVQEAADLFPILQAILKRENTIDRNREHFYTIALLPKNKIKFIELISFGSSNAVVVAPTEVYRLATIRGIKKIIVAHNHPSGDLFPSPNDRKLTDRLKKSGEILEVNLLDHIIFDTDNYFSMVEKGLF